MAQRSELLALAPEERKSKANPNSANDQETVNLANNTPEDSPDKLKTHRFNPNFTQSVINAMGPKTSPRMRKVITSMIQHIHDFARENEITVEEWMTGMEFINQAGQMSNELRNETQIVCDVIGLESLVDEITHKLVAEAENAPTAPAVLGPFWRADAPKLEMGSSIVFNTSDGDHTYMHGIVKDCLTGEPIEGAVLDVWHTAPNGLYEQQDENQVDYNLHGRFTTAKDGRYSFYCLRPTSYPIPADGPAGKLLKLLDRHPMRPAHIHVIVTAPDYKPLVTQIFDRRSDYLDDDAVFAVKEDLMVDFLPRENDPNAQFELAYDFRLATFEEAKTHSLKGATEGSRSI